MFPETTVVSVYAKRSWYVSYEFKKLTVTIICVVIITFYKNIPFQNSFNLYQKFIVPNRNGLIRKTIILITFIGRCMSCKLHSSSLYCKLDLIIKIMFATKRFIYKYQANQKSIYQNTG